MCGFDFGKLPGADNMSRFVSKLSEHQDDILAIFVSLSNKLYDIIPDFGECLAIDGKWVWSAANKRSTRKSPDGRSEKDAEWGRKDYKGRRDDGTEWSKTVKCFGFKMHVIVDAKYELPVAFITTGANGSDIKYGKKIFEELAKKRPYIIERCSYLMADRGYDDEKFIIWLKKKGIKSIIDKRDMWRTDEEKEVPKYGGGFCLFGVVNGRHRSAKRNRHKSRADSGEDQKRHERSRGRRLWRPYPGAGALHRAACGWRNSRQRDSENRRETRRGRRAAYRKIRARDEGGNSYKLTYRLSYRNNELFVAWTINNRPYEPLWRFWMDLTEN
jgi:hypothetical protein